MHMILDVLSPFFGGGGGGGGLIVNPERKVSCGLRVLI